MKQPAQMDELESLKALRRAARMWAGWEPPEAIAAEESSSAEKPSESGQETTQGLDAGK